MDREVITKSRVTVGENRGNGGGISRRSFLKGAGGIAAAAAVLGLSGSKALAQPILPSITVPKETLLEMYRRMQRIGQGEMKIRELFKKGIEPGKGLLLPGHTSRGEEATCVGVGMAMERGDMLVGSHRSHGYPLAVGVELKPWMAELYGKVTGTNKGHGGTMHIADPKKGVLGMAGLVGGQVPHALGAAWGFKLQGKKNVAISTCGDGAINSSGFGTSPNLAGIWDLPVVFVINNNHYESFNQARKEQQLLKRGQDLSVRAAGFAVPGITVDGMDVFAVYKAAKYCMDRARRGEGPTVLECVCYRYWCHFGIADHEVTEWPYNDPAELKYWLRKDPIKRFERNVVQGGLLTEKELEAVSKAITAEVEEAIEFGRTSPFPDPEEVFKYSREVLGA